MYGDDRNKGRRPADGSDAGRRRPANGSGSSSGQRRTASGSGSNQRRPSDSPSSEQIRRSASGGLSQRRPASGNVSDRSEARRSSVRNGSASGKSASRTGAGAGSGSRRPADRNGSGSKRPANKSGAGTGTKRRSQMTMEERKWDEYNKLKARNRKRQQVVMTVCICLIALLVFAGILWSIAKGIKSPANGDKSANGSTPSSQLTVTKGAGEEQGGQPSATSAPSPTPTPEVKEISLVAVGDDLVHTGVYQAGRQSDGTFDYSCLFANIKPYLEGIDIKVINQETIFGGDDKGLSSYPSFNSPTAIGDEVVAAGFNVVLHASNHALDMGLDGLLNCVSFWKTKHPETLMLGIYENAEEQSEIPIMEVKGVKFAMLNYTYNHNWETLSKNADGHLNMLCAWDPDSRVIDLNTINPRVLEDIKKAEELADFTIVFPHWGTEYVMDYTKQQSSFAQQMTEAGADLIIGTHPHVIEPVEWVTADNGNKALCYYSLGNFTSTQDQLERVLGGMAKLTIVSDETGVHIDEESIKAIPLVTHYIYPGWSGSTVVETTYALKDYTADLAKKHGLLNRKGITVTVDKLTALAQETFGEYYSLD